MSDGKGKYPGTSLRRAVYAIMSIIIVMLVGIVGFHYIEGMNYINAFYFESMLATGQGPPFPLLTDSGKIFASVMAFVSVGSVITTLIFTLGPILAQFWKEELERVEQGARAVEKDIDHGMKKDEDGSVS
jgi:voltage-gated potassium channel